MANPFPLDTLQVASPCPAAWEAMTGDNRVRFCGDCRRHVYDLSALTRTEAEQLIAEKEGNLCVRFYRRADGKVLTADCPVGAETLRRRVIHRVAAAAGAVVGLLTWLLVIPAVWGPNRGSAWLRRSTPVGDLLEWADPTAMTFTCVGGMPSFSRQGAGGPEVPPGSGRGGEQSTGDGR